MKLLKGKHSGNSLVELLIVMGLFTVMFVTSSLSLSSTRSRTTLGTTVDTLVADLRSQQTKAMSGDTGGGSGNINYGVKFLANSYFLFKKDDTDPDKFEVVLDNVQITNSFTGSEIIFQKGNGEILGFDPLLNTFRLTSISNPSNQKFIVVNRLGVIENIY